MKELTGHEKVFYVDQQTTRECCISEEIDEDYENEQLTLYQEISQQKQQEHVQYDFVMEDDEELPSSNANLNLDSSIDTSLNFNVNRSGHARWIRDCYSN